LVGESGSGKSTIVNLLLALYQPSLGEILVDGSNLGEVDSLTWRKRIGVVDQEVYLLNTSIKENIIFGRQNISDLDIYRATNTALAHEFIENLENGYQTVVGDRGHKLSGGQQQRIALARALVSNPDILVLDEATSSLDSISERYIQKAIENMHESRTIIVIAHRLSTVSAADKILVLDSGNIVESGTKNELIREGGVFSKLWATQYR
jgi:ABC-type multidrug transport system fused ATPase/permease subunit